MKRKRRKQTATSPTIKPRPKSPKDIAREFIARCWPDGLPEDQRHEMMKTFLAGMFAGITDALENCDSERDLADLLQAIKKAALDINAAQS
jgi:hypothetical protein